MAGTLQFDLVSPERRLASVVASEVQIPGADGDLTAMEGHAPTITTLRPGVLKVVSTEGAKAYVVTYNKVPGSAADRYLMAHSQLAFLMGPDGKPLALLPLDDPSTDPDEGAPDKVAADLAKWVK